MVRELISCGGARPLHHSARRIMVPVLQCGQMSGFGAAPGFLALISGCFWPIVGESGSACRISLSNLRLAHHTGHFAGDTRQMVAIAKAEDGKLEVAQ